MMSSSELQRISLSTSKIVIPEGTITLEPIQTSDSRKNDDTENNSTKEDGDSEAPNATKHVFTSTSTATTAKKNDTNTDHAGGLTNGIDEGNSPNRANETLTSSMGDITVDSVRDHLNSTTTTLCSTTTEETVGK